MFDSSIQWIAVLGFVIIGTLFATEVRRWRSLERVIGRRQKVIRVCLIVLIEALFVMMFVGPWATTRRNPVAALVYWSVCVLLALAVIILAAVDLRHVMRGYASLTREMFSDLRGGDRRDQ
jgi:hypothetical protein